MPQLTLRDVFVDCQGGMHCHGRLVKSLSKVYHATPLEKFWEDFVHHLRYNMIVFKREPAVERTIEFVAKFATSLCKNAEKPKKDDEAEEDGEEDEEEMHPFLLKIFSFLLKHHNACDKAVRFRCCQLVNKLLVSLGEDAQIDDDLYDKIYECMLQRLRDKFPAVRVQSVLALTRLQDPQNRECPVISAYLFLLGCDTNPDVRRAALSCIAATTKTLPAILERSRDTKELVRKLAFQVIADKIHVRALTIAQRVSVLQEGLNDRSEQVREACTTRLLQSWLRTFQGNILDLLKCLDVENALDTSDQMLKALFEKSPVSELLDNFDLLNQELTLPIEELTSESALYWRTLCSYLKSLGVAAEESLERILPTGTKLAVYLKIVSDHMAAESNLDAQLRNEFIFHQLLALAALLDFSDEVGRREMNDVLRSLLLSEHITHSSVKSVLEVLALIQTDPEARVTTLVEIIADIREPISTVEISQNKEAQRQRDLKLAGIRVELNQIREDLEDSIKRQSFSTAATIKARITELEASKQELMSENILPASQEVRVEKNDPVTLMKCLTIASEMLTDQGLTSLTATLQTLMEVLIIPGIQNEDPAIRNSALRALGLCCLLSKDEAKAHLLLFMQVAQIDQEAIKMTALKVIFDLLHTFGLEAFEVDPGDEETSSVEDRSRDGDRSRDEAREDGEEEEDQTEDVLEDTQMEAQRRKEKKVHTAESVLMILTSLLDSDSSDLRTVAGEGLAKLLLSGRVVSHKVMSRLLLLWYNPVTEDDGHLRHCLGAFFPIFAFAGRANQQVLEESFMPTLRTLYNAPATSPLAEINMNNVAELLTQLTNTRHLVNQPPAAAADMEDTTPHDNLVIKVCNEILTDPKSFNVRSLCRILNLLELSPGNVSSLKDLKVLSKRMLQEVKDKQCSKLLEKFHRTTNDLYTRACALGALSGAGDLSTVDEDIAEVVPEPQENNTVLKEIDNTLMQEENAPETLPDNEGDTTGIRRLRSKREKSAKATDSDAKRTRSSKSTKTSKAARGTENSSESDNGENSLFASPTPVRRSARSRTGPSSQQPQTSISSLRKTRKKLQEILSDSDSPYSDNDPGNNGKSKTRSQGPRTPLSDIENEVK